MLHGPQSGLFDLDFRLPSECADRLASGQADIGIIPSFELTRQRVEVIRGTGIASHGAVRSILLVSSCPAPQIRVLAADSSSRTSVALARIILERRYGASPGVHSQAPDLQAMLSAADAALIIGDPALRIDLVPGRYYAYDLGSEWMEMTGLPMVFAVWAGGKEAVTPEVSRAFRESYFYGREHMEDIVRSEALARNFPAALVREYLTKHIVHELTARDYEGMELFLEYARQLQPGVERSPVVDPAAAV